MKTKLRFMALILLGIMLSVNQVWATDPTMTENFENQESSTTYNGQVTYSSDDSNVKLGWFVEHGTVSTNNPLTGDQSLQMRAYYAKKSAASTWNGALPYLHTKTAVKGLKSVSFSIKSGNTSLKYDTYYSTDGTTWTSIQTSQATSTSKSTKSFDIPNSSSTTNYYIKIAVSTSSTHTANPSSTGSIACFIDDVCFTYTAASTKTAV